MSSTQVEGWAELTEWFGPRGGFHDSEVLSLDLRRDPELSLLRVRAVRFESELYGGGPLTYVLVTFTLREISELVLDDWNHQNVLGGVTLQTTEAGHTVCLEPCFGVWGRITAASASITFEAFEAEPT